MELKGTVLNVVDFGAFVDVGLKDSGLVHISQMANKYIKSPYDVVSVNDIVTVWVLKIDKDAQPRVADDDQARQRAQARRSADQRPPRQRTGRPPQDRGQRPPPRDRGPGGPPREGQGQREIRAADRRSAAAVRRRARAKPTRRAARQRRRRRRLPCRRRGSRAAKRPSRS